MQKFINYNYVDSQSSILTIFTPTYNRGGLLPVLYKSLKEQTNDSFVWMIIDDGSTDNTKDLIDGWKKDGIINLEYYYKRNGGKHSAINYMLDIISTPLVFIVDSDDYISRDAVDTIVKDYAKIKCANNICELVYLRGDFDGNVVGTAFDKEGIIENPVRYMFKNKIKGDKCSALITSIWGKYRFPEYRDELFMGESVLINKVYSHGYCAYVSNAIIYFCEYREDGLTKLGRKMRVSQPLGGMEHANSYLSKSLGIGILMKVKYGILYCCYGVLADKPCLEIFRNINCKSIFLFCIIPGKLLSLLWRLKYIK